MPQSLTPSFDDLADSAFIRAGRLVPNRKHPERPHPLAFSNSTLWRKSADGSFPKPVKLSARVTAWRVGDIRAWMDALQSDAPALTQ